MMTLHTHITPINITGIAAVKRGVTLRQFVIDAIKAALETK